jgi:D-psicose/D-tagatose/L-ribulose 3-epimerase
VALRYAVHGYAWTARWVRSDAAIVDHVAAMGLDAIEVPLMDLDEVEPLEIRERCEDAGISVLTSTALSFRSDPSSADLRVRQRARDELVRCVEVAAEMGAPLLSGVIYGALGGALDERPTPVHYERSAAVLRDVLAHAKACGVGLAIEPINRYETFLVNTVAQAHELAELVGDDALGLHLDAYHMNIEEDEFYRPVLEAVPRLRHFHLSESHRGIPGRGTVDWYSIFRALRDGEYDGYVGLESFVGISPAMAGATRVWRDLAPDSDTLVREGYAFLKALELRVAGEGDE